MRNLPPRSLAEHFGKQTVWRPAGRPGGKPTDALTGYTMPQLVDIACGWDATRCLRLPPTPTLTPRCRVSLNLSINPNPIAL